MMRARYTVLLVCSIAFFVSSLFLYWPRDLAFSSPYAEQLWYPVLLQPDEAVNYFFTQTLVRTGEFRVVEPLSTFTDNQVHPRSMTVIYGALAPIGFPGFIGLLSVIVKWCVLLFGAWILPYASIAVVPLIGALFPLLLFGIVRRISASQILAYYAALLCYIVPMWWYWSARALQHAVPFTFLLFASIYAGLRFVESQKNIAKSVWALVLGLALASAILLRPNEIVWIAPLCMYFFLRFSLLRHVRLWYVLPSALLVLLYGLSLQVGYYGSFSGTGYATPIASGAAGSISTFSFFHLLFPFGFHVVNILKTIYQYAFVLFGVLSSAIIASYFLVWRHGNDVWKEYCRVWLACSLFVLCYYGSWYFADNVFSMPSIGSSQTRYFLPVVMGAVPFLAFSIEYITHASWKRMWKIVCACVLMLVFLQGAYRLIAPPEGLQAMSRTVDWYYAQRLLILYQVPENAVVVTRREDKYIFPFRKIIPGMQESYYALTVKKLLESDVPVYLYDMLDKPYCTDLQSFIFPLYAIQSAAPLSCDSWQLVRLEKAQ